MSDFTERSSFRCVGSERPLASMVVLKVQRARAALRRNSQWPSVLTDLGPL